MADADLTKWLAEHPWKDPDGAPPLKLAGPDLRTIDFTIIETFRDYWDGTHGRTQHFTRPTDDGNFEPCPLGDNCLGPFRCHADLAYEKAKTSGIE